MQAASQHQAASQCTTSVGGSNGGTSLGPLTAAAAAGPRLEKGFWMNGTCFLLFGHCYYRCPSVPPSFLVLHGPTDRTTERPSLRVSKPASERVVLLHSAVH